MIFNPTWNNMTIKAVRLKDELKNPSGLVLTLDETAKDQLTILLNRALNTWPEAPKDWKELADYLVHGRVLQNYDNYEQKPKQAHIT